MGKNKWLVKEKKKIRKQNQPALAVPEVPGETLQLKRKSINKASTKHAYLLLI